MTITTLKRNLTGVVNYVRMDCDNSLSEITTPGFFNTNSVVDSIQEINKGLFSFLDNDFLVVTYALGRGLFNFDSESNCLIALLPGDDIFTFQPEVSFETPGDLSVVYDFRFGTYYIVGNMVFMTINLSFRPTYTTASGSLIVTGIPKVVLRVTGSSMNEVGTNLVWPAGVTQLFPIIFNTDDTMRIRGVGNGVQVTLGTSSFPSGVDVSFSSGMTYILLES